MDLSYASSHNSDDAAIAQALPGQTRHQGLQLFHTELLVPVQCCRSRPDKLAFVESPPCQPDANAVMHKHLDAIGPAVGKQVGVVGMRRADHEANSLAADMGQVTVMTRPPLRTSTVISR